MHRRPEPQPRTRFPPKILLNIFYTIAEEIFSIFGIVRVLGRLKFGLSEEIDLFRIGEEIFDGCTEAVEELDGAVVIWATK